MNEPTNPKNESGVSGACKTKTREGRGDEPILDLQTTTEQRHAERGRRRAHHDGGDEQIDRRRKTARRRASRIWRRRTSIVGFGRRNDDGDESERSEYEREERARGVDVWRRRSRGEERKVEEEGDVMAEVANETWKNGYIDDGRANG